MLVELVDRRLAGEIRRGVLGKWVGRTVPFVGLVSRLVSSDLEGLSQQKGRRFVFLPDRNSLAKVFGQFAVEEDEARGASFWDRGWCRSQRA